VAFGLKKQHIANLLIWFNTPAIKLEQSQIALPPTQAEEKAKICNKHTHPNAKDALISRMCYADFLNGYPDIRWMMCF
jgi:hypothetical protein